MLPDDLASSDRYYMGIRVSHIDNDRAFRRDARIVLEEPAVRYQSSGWSEDQHLAIFSEEAT
jgi:hypothetical protein